MSKKCRQYSPEFKSKIAIAEALETAKTCLTREGGCIVVPGLPREQWILTLISSILSSVICGFAAVPCNEDQVFAWQWAQCNLWICRCSL